MLQVIQHEQQAPVAEAGHQAVDDHFAAGLRYAQNVRDGVEDQTGIGQGRQINEDDAVGERRERHGGEVEGETRLADATGSGQREQAHVLAT